jgi:biopolymer transport protein ExbB
MTGTALIGATVSGSAPADPAAAPGGSPSPAASPDGGAPTAPAAAPAGETPAAPSAAPPSAAPESAAPPSAAPAGASGFVGDIDELQIAKVARSAGFIKVAAIGQGPEHAKLVTFSVDEETAGWFSGYFAVILKSVTLDGWVVIAMLAVMAVISWVVMIDKWSLLGRSAKGNKLFLKHFREAARDLDSLLQLDREQTDAGFTAKVAAKEGKAIQASPLYRLLHLGAQEIRQRFSTNGDSRTLSPQAIEAIRAVLDAGFVNETQRLNRMMVMLTIAISGGPFLGLLGTVVGVMITFAAIAATGDVNVNAIAPGIAAALVATVAGLGVAIPALFGYNYLISGIKDITSEMQVFIDEFITKTAESYHARRNGPTALAAE